MPVMLPSAEQLALWASEQLWDWRVRVLFAAICAIAMVAALVIYLAWGRNENRAATGKPRRYLGRVSVTLLLIAGGEIIFFKEPVSAILLLGTALAIGLIAFGMPERTQDDAQDTASG